MSTDSGRRDGAAGLTDRRRECSMLNQLIEAIRAGESRALVIRGEPGVGKTVLLDHLAGQAQGFRVVRAVGVQSEMELAFAGLHQLCAPMLDHLGSIPVPQRDALQTTALSVIRLVERERDGDGAFVEGVAADCDR